MNGRSTSSTQMKKNPVYTKVNVGKDTKKHEKNLFEICKNFKISNCKNLSR